MASGKERRRTNIPPWKARLPKRSGSRGSTKEQFVILRAIGAVVKDDLKTVSFMEDWIADDQIPF